MFKYAHMKVKNKYEFSIHKYRKHTYIGYIP